MTTGSLSTWSPKILQYDIDDHDRISKLPDVLLQKIVSKLSTEEAVRTSILSSRWVDVWKCMSHLVLDTREVLDITTKEHKDLHRLSVLLARRYNEANLLSLHPDTFSHHGLSSLSLCGYTLIGPHAFRKCKNLKTLKLTNIFISQPSVLSGNLAAFSSLEVIVLNVNFPTPHGVLKIENNSLKFLQLSFPYEIDRMEVYATCLNVLDIDSRFINTMRDNFILIASNIKEEKNIWHELLGRNFDDIRRFGCLSVSVDITDPKEMEILKEVLLRYWTKLVMELEIFSREGDKDDDRDFFVSSDEEVQCGSLCGQNDGTS
ncbi:hypothetical protein Bca101_020364 [Brassica carinata]